MIFMRSLSIAVMSQIKLIPTPSWIVYFVLKTQPFFINFVAEVDFVQTIGLGQSISLIYLWLYNYALHFNFLRFFFAFFHKFECNFFFENLLRFFCKMSLRCVLFLITIEHLSAAEKGATTLSITTFDRMTFGKMKISISLHSL